MKKHQSLFTLIFAIYVIAGIVAIVLFHNNGSHLSHKLEQPVLAENESVPETADSQTPDLDTKDMEVVNIIEIPSEDVPESDTTDTTEETDDAASDAASSVTLTEESPDVSDTAEAEITTDEVSNTDKVNDQPDEALPETNEKKYYGYTVNAGVSSVRVRETADRSSKIISHVNGGDTGYVIEKGDIRSQIVLQDGTVGYIYNEYIAISEIPKKEVPKEYR